MAHQYDGNALALQGLQDLREHLLEVRVHALGRFIQEQDIRFQQQNLRQRCPLLLPAGQIVRMTVQQRLQPAQLHHPGHLFVPLRILRRQHLQQVFPDALFNEQRLRILGQHADLSRASHRAAQRFQQTAQQL